MLIADYLHRIKKRLKKKIGGSRKKSGGSADKRRRKKALRYLGSKDARIYKKMDGIHLIQYPDHIAASLLEGTLWGRKDFDSALAVLRPWLREGAFIDFGANSGTQSIYAARERLFTKIIAIEPLTSNFELLCANLRLNDVDNAVPVHCAVSDREGELRLPIKRSKLGASGFGIDAGEFELVQTRRLDNLLDELGIDASSAALIWMCVRGHENESLDGMTRLLAGQVPLVIDFCPVSKTEKTIQILQQHYKNCASEDFAQGPQPTASLNPEVFRDHKWLAVW